MRPNVAIGVIPVRFGSIRFPGKPLAPILGKPMVQWVYEGAARAVRLERVIVATDDKRIYEAARSFGAEAAMTSPDCASGTDRAAEVAARTDALVFVNIQGDEPLIEGDMLDSLVDAVESGGADMASLMIRESDPALLADPNAVKVVVNRRGDALYFSRSPLRSDVSDYFYRHIGIYAFRRDVLLGYGTLPASRLEKAERLEQLRALDNGLRVRMIETSRPTLSVDVPEDIIKAENHLRRRTP
ncbi:MAG: 3-deoxy-manno-octulosonate cytidylyltransferase [Acidobacteriota bacterium]|nr:3-deoxy-manno-octulosonate cytidylyltransferase [Acidobacteriota bacterium]